MQKTMLKLMFRLVIIELLLLNTSTTIIRFKNGYGNDNNIIAYNLLLIYF